MNNQLMLIGRVGQEPQAVTFPDSTNQVVKFSLAVDQYSSKKDEESTLWIDVDAWNGLGERVLEYVTVGREVVLIGRLAINRYVPKGGTNEVQKPIMKLTSFHLVGPKPQAAEESESKKASRRPVKTA